jgi:hypothetical protein
MEAPREQGEDAGDGSTLVLSILLAVVAIQTFFPLLSIGLVTNDDLKLANAALDRGARGVASVLWSFTRRDGRLDLAQLLSWYVPFAVDSFAYFKVVTLAAIAADLVLFAQLVRSVLRDRGAFFLALLLGLVGLQNSLEHSPLTAFPGLLTLTLAYFLGSLLAFQRFLEKATVGTRALSAVLFLLALCSYEIYVIYTPLFFGLALWAGRPPRAALRAMALHLAALALYLAAWFISHTFRLGDYPGVTIPREFDVSRFARVVWQFSVSSLPSYFFFVPKYGFLLEALHREAGVRGLWVALTAGSMIKAAAVALAYAILMRRPAGASRLRRGGTIALAAAGVVYFFAPSVLPALTERYQAEVEHQLGMQVTYFSTFAWVGLATLLLPLCAARLRGRVRSAWVGATAAVLAMVSLAVDYTNASIAEMQARGRHRFAMVDAFIESADYQVIPEGAMLYAPSLFQSIRTINFVGTAIDPRPSADARYENFWTFYFTRRGGRRVTVADRPERLPDAVAAQGFYYLKQVQPTPGRGQYLVFAHVRRPEEPPRPLVSEMVMVYDRAPWSDRLLGGRVAEGRSPASVRLVGGGTFPAADIFVFDVADHAFDMGDLRRSAVAADGAVLDAESVFLAPGVPPEAREQVFKTSGWFPDGWIGAEARATLRPTGPARLVVEAYAPDYLFRKVGIGPRRVTLEVDGAPLAVRTLTRGGRFRIGGNVGAGGPGALVVHCDPTHSPSDAGITGDDRRLCVVIERVAIRSRLPGE